MQQPALSVLIATRNGQRVIGRSLEGYRRQTSIGYDWDIVVVDNASTDSTSAIVESFRQHLPLKILNEPVPGKNRALNLGLEHVAGELIVLSDDDAIPAPGFLHAWSKMLHTRTEYGMFGGRIELLFEVPPPKWMLRDQRTQVLFPARDLPEGIVQPHDIFGPNMAVRRAVFERGLRFDESIGPNGSDPLYPEGSETEFLQRAARAGIAAWFSREPLVQHIVRPHQTTDSYLADRAYRHGRGIALRLHMEGRLHEEVDKDRLWWLKRRIEMLSPFPIRRRKGIFQYYVARGIDDERRRHVPK